MHGHHHGGIGGHGWGGWGWFFPALIIGKLIGSLFDQRPLAQPYPVYPPPPQTPPAPSQPPAATTTVNMVMCQNCRHSVAAGQAYCSHCGTRLGAQTCRYCGQSLPPDSRYCGHCGAPRK